MASAANNQTIESTPAAGTRIFNATDDGGGCTSFQIRCREDSANPVLVRVPGLHKDGEFVAIPPGESMVFRYGAMSRREAIAEVYAKGDGGDADIDYAVAAKLYS